jgi:pantoate--beta-alanine ligase
MILFKKRAELGAYREKVRQQGLSVGFAPTMGALHSGHLSLIHAAKKTNSLTVASIFVNPTQFNDPKDYQKYPVTLENDIALLEEAGCDILFLPAVTEIYPEGSQATQHFDLGYLETILEGKFRPGHFQGVCNVMQRLLNLVKPDNLYMGQKDYQQCMVIKQLLQLMNSTTRLHTCTTLREHDGLAMSSRNMRLNATERQQAIAIYETLLYIKNHFRQTSLSSLQKYATDYLQQKGFSKVDYIAFANADNLTLLTQWNGTDPLVVLVAAFLNEVRLIDNMLLDENVN